MLKALIRRLYRFKSKKILERILPFLEKSDKILDIGSGTGDLDLILREQGTNVVPLDVKGYRWSRVLDPVIYNGDSIPFKKNTFDKALILMVMHHTKNPEKIIREASRVAKEIIVIETSYINVVHKFLTVLLDTVVNLQPNFYWNSYHSDKEWRGIFFSNGFVVEESRKYWDFYTVLPFSHIVYHLKKK